MKEISGEVAVKLIVELLKWVIVAAVLTGYREWWPRLRGVVGRLWLGGQRRLDRLDKLISRYENYTHVEEMESQSKVHRSFANAFRMVMLSLLLSMPLFIVLVTLFGRAIIADVVINLKPGTAPPLPHHLWILRIYGAVLGICLGLVSHHLEQAGIAASDLSADHRKDRLDRWRQAREKIKNSLGRNQIEPAVQRESHPSIGEGPI